MDATPSYETTAVLCAAIVALAETLKYVVAKFASKGNGRSGEKPIEFWEKDIENIVEKVVARVLDARVEDAVDRSVHQAFSSRNEEIRRIIHEEIGSARWRRE